VLRFDNVQCGPQAVVVIGYLGSYADNYGKAEVTITSKGKNPKTTKEIVNSHHPERKVSIYHQHVISGVSGAGQIVTVEITSVPQEEGLTNADQSPCPNKFKLLALACY
jgi:hypothetical protein